MSDETKTETAKPEEVKQPTHWVYHLAVGALAVILAIGLVTVGLVWSGAISRDANGGLVVGYPSVRFASRQQAAPAPQQQAAQQPALPTTPAYGSQTAYKDGVGADGQLALSEQRTHTVALRPYIDQKIDASQKATSEQIAQSYKRLGTKLDTTFGKIVGKVDTLSNDVAGLNGKFAHLDSRVSTLEKNAEKAKAPAPKPQASIPTPMSAPQLQPESQAQPMEQVARNDVGNGQMMSASEYAHIAAQASQALGPAPQQVSGFMVTKHGFHQLRNPHRNAGRCIVVKTVHRNGNTYRRWKCPN